MNLPADRLFEGLGRARWFLIPFLVILALGLGLLVAGSARSGAPFTYFAF